MVKKIYEEIDADKIVTIGIYGDDIEENFREYKYRIGYFKDACRKAGIEISNDDTYDFSGGWEMDLTGDPRTIYKLVNYRIPGYNCDSLEEFINQYEI